MNPLVLGRDACLHILGCLDASSVLALGACSREWHQLAADEAAWNALCRRDQQSLAAQHELTIASGGTWRAAYARAHRLQALRRVRWQPEAAPGGRRPREREGHAACAWGRRSMLLHGGFGGGILRDLHILAAAPPSPSPSLNAATAGSSGGSGGGSSPAHGGAGSAGASGSGSGCKPGTTGPDPGSSRQPNPGLQQSPAYRWVQPQVTGAAPLPRYGHTLSRCVGPDGSDIAVIFGGLLAGGYQAPLDTVAVLRRKPAAAAPLAAAGGEAAAGAAEQEGKLLREADTSLARRLQEAGGGGGGAAAFGQLAWHPMLLVGEDFWEQEEEDWMGSGDDEGSEDDADSFENWMEAEEHGDSDSGDESMEDDTGSEGSQPRDSLDGAATIVAAEAAAAIAAAETAPAAAQAALQHAGNPDLEAPNAQPASPAQQAPQWQAGQRAPCGCQGRGPEEEDWEAAEWEWWYPPVQGEPPGARGYHSAAVSEDGKKIYFFGGIGAGGACNSLAVLDIATWTWSRPLTTGQPPSPRCGHSSVVYGGKLWVVGGGSGRDLLRSGRDFDDVHTLDLQTLEWAKLALPPGPACAGKCHAACRVGSRLLLYGGSMPTCSELAWLDLEAGRWGAPAAVLGWEPAPRMSSAAVLAGEEVLVYGGFTFSAREVGDLHRLRLVVDEEEEECEAAAAGAARRAAGQAMRRWRSLWI
ncbi:hypothetical protein ABPG75_000484 [Micractinium tetrahymenae]